MREPLPRVLLAGKLRVRCRWQSPTWPLFSRGSGRTFDNPLLRLCLEDPLRENEEVYLHVVCPISLGSAGDHRGRVGTSGGFREGGT
jgi:hypothetical protein